MSTSDTDPSDWVDSFKEEMEPSVFAISVAALLVFAVIRLAVPQATQDAVRNTRVFLQTTFGPLFMVLMLLFVFFCIFLLISPWGSIRLGGENASPSYTYPAYFAMFFSAGIAAGIVFWGPAEALYHFSSPPPFVNAGASTAAAAVGAMQTTMFHWIISAWSAYVVIGVPIAYLAYNKGAPLRISTLLVPFIGKDGLDGPLAKLVDTLAIFATIGGVATSVGFVGNQFMTGIQYQWGVSTGSIDALIVVAGLTIIFTVSVVTGVNRGIRRIATANFGLFLVVAAVLLVVGPTVFMIRNGVMGTLTFFRDFFYMSLYPLLTGGVQSGSFYSVWTVFYWVWWFSWAPFAGLFLAAISKGRTLRTVVFTGVVATSIATGVWFVILGGTSLSLQMSGAADILGVMGEFGVAAAAFPLLNALPLGGLLVFLFFALIITWIVTSADTSTLAVSILATERNVAPSTSTRVFWGVLQGAVGVGVILIGAGNALQAAAIITGGPFSVIALVGVAGIIKELYGAEIEGGQWVVDAARDAIQNR